MTYRYDHPRPALTVDCVVFGLDEGDLKLLLVQRSQEPFRHRWALPGGLVGMEESAERAARRELEEETGVRDVYLEQLYTFSAVDRDPRERTISIAYYALVKMTDHVVRAATDAGGAAWFSVTDAQDLAFDHDLIVHTACERLRGKLRYQPIGFELLPEKFKLSQLQRLYEVVLGTPLDKRNFRKKILAMDLLRPLDEVEQGVAHRAARLYRFDSRRYQELRRRGFNFEL
ncbi:MAG: NUDIX hydrolase [Polyangiaceae bacterium]|nr:NUDIX hydrolase [Polyangiaceae bacterium]MCW5789699.1 NUDIX hydrolase [Polyangiaceae bacterium]